MFAVTLLVIARPPDAMGKSWRQIKPMRSTSHDVARLFKGCEEVETRCQFTLEDQEVMIVFSGSNIGALECKLVPKRTVLAIIIKFSRPRSIKTFHLKNRKPKIFDPSSPPKQGYKTYYYEPEGFMINTYKGEVIGLVYVASQKDIHLCPEYYDDPRAFVDVGLVP